MGVRMKTVCLTAMAAGLVFACGWMMGRWHRPEGKEEAVAAEARPGHLVHEASVTHGERPAGDPSPREAEMAVLFPGGVSWRQRPEDHERLMAWIRTASPADLEGMIEALGDPPEPSWVMDEVFRAWAAGEPQAALRRFGAWPAWIRFRLVNALVSGWAEKDTEGAVAWLAAQPVNAASDEARAAVLKSLARTDPEAALATLRETDWLRDSPQAMGMIFQVWVEQNPVVALQQWRSLNLELNPPLMPGAEPPVSRFTSYVLGMALSHAAETKGPDAVLALIELQTPRELSAIETWQWERAGLARYPESLLPVLENKLPSEKMTALVAQLARSAPHQAEAMKAALHNPALRALSQPSATSLTFAGIIEAPAVDAGAAPAFDAQPDSIRISLDEPISLGP